MIMIAISIVIILMDLTTAHVILDMFLKPMGEVA